MFERREDGSLFPETVCYIYVYNGDGGQQRTVDLCLQSKVVSVITSYDCDCKLQL
jgi:hypothetical protein